NDPNTQVITGDFNGDKKTDIILKNAAYTTTPMFLSNGDGTWVESNNATPSWINDPGTQVVTGDFNGDDKTDVILKHAGWGSTPMFLSNGDATWVLSHYTTLFRTNDPNTQVITGDFNGDKKTDIILKNAAYTTTPMFLSNGD